MKFLGRLLPHNPDVLGMLSYQSEMTIAGLAALVEWAQGDADADAAVGDAEHEADVRKKALWKALREAFITPIGAEDIFVMSARLDAVLNGAKDLVREAGVLEAPPDSACEEMAKNLAEGAGVLFEAFEALRAGPKHFGRATEAADEAKRLARNVEKLYRAAMKVLLADDDLREVATRRELYRRLLSISVVLVEVSERVWYAAVKEA